MAGAFPRKALGGVDSEVIALRRHEALRGHRLYPAHGHGRRIPLVNDIRKAKEETFEIPEKYLLGRPSSRGGVQPLGGRFLHRRPRRDNYETSGRPIRGQWRYQCSLSCHSLHGRGRGRVMAAPVITLSAPTRTLHQGGQGRHRFPGIQLEYQRASLPLGFKIVSVRGNEVRMRLGARWESERPRNSASSPRMS
jgi:hypothetical protein